MVQPIKFILNAGDYFISSKTKNSLTLLFLYMFYYFEYSFLLSTNGKYQKLVNSWFTKKKTVAILHGE